MIVYVATIPLKYEVMAVAATEAEAVSLVSVKAHDYLNDAGWTDSDTDSPAKVADYYGVAVTAMPLGEAGFTGFTKRTR